MRSYLPLIVLALLAGAVLSTKALAEDAGAKVEYLGGTVGEIQKHSDGRLLTTNDRRLLLRLKKVTLSVPWDNINLLEYGQKVNRRIAESLLISPLFLLSKKRKHFLTIGFTDEAGDQNAMVFEVNRNDVRQLLVGLEARTGLKVTYQDEEARKSGKG